MGKEQYQKGSEGKSKHGTIKQIKEHLKQRLHKTSDKHFDSDVHNVIVDFELGLINDADLLALFNEIKQNCKDKARAFAMVNRDVEMRMEVSRIEAIDNFIFICKTDNLQQ